MDFNQKGAKQSPVRSSLRAQLESLPLVKKDSLSAEVECKPKIASKEGLYENKAILEDSGGRAGGEREREGGKISNVV